MARAVVEDPLKVFRFRVEIDQFERAGFREVNGLEASVEVAEYREGGDNHTVKKSPGLASFSNITLIRGQIIGSDQGGDDEIVDWFKNVFDVTQSLPIQAENPRRSLEIVQYDPTFTERRRWEVQEAFPVRFKPFSDMNATSNDNSVEEVELANEGFELSGGE